VVRSSAASDVYKRQDFVFAMGVLASDPWATPACRTKGIRWVDGIID
jgi:hypothetical protein